MTFNLKVQHILELNNYEDYVDNKLYSLYHLLDELYEAKRLYYKGSPKLTDKQFDALESSIKNIHGNKVFEEWYTVGYDEEKHKIIKKNCKEESKKFKEWFNNKKRNT